MTYEIAKVMGVNVTYGWLITQVTSGAPAANAGIRGGTKQILIAGECVTIGGDIIIAINGTRMRALIPPKKIGIYLPKTAKLMQNVIATICLRPEDEITVDSLLEDLERSMELPLDYHQVGHTIQYLKRAGLISFEWHQKIIKREKPLKEYVTKQLMTIELWSKIAQDWHKISRIIKEKYGKINSEYQELLLHKSRNRL